MKPWLSGMSPAATEVASASSAPGEEAAGACECAGRVDATVLGAVVGTSAVVDVLFVWDVLPQPASRTAAPITARATGTQPDLMVVMIVAFL